MTFSEISMSSELLCYIDMIVLGKIQNEIMFFGGHIEAAVIVLFSHCVIQLLCYFSYVKSNIIVNYLDTAQSSL